MWVLAGVLGLAVVAVTLTSLFVCARLLPAGRTRELVAFIPNCISMLRVVRRDRRLPARARLALGAALVYLLSPVQVIPNFLPVIGQTDDVVVVVWALRYACRRLPRETVEAAWPGEPATLDRLLGRRDRTSSPTGP